MGKAQGSTLSTRAAIAVLRLLPVSDRRKHRLIALLSTRYGVGVHAVIRDEHGRCLTLEATYIRELQFPGGAVHSGEQLATALQREVEEELGCRVAWYEGAGVRFDGTDGYVQFVYRAALTPGPIQLSVEHRAWRFMDPEELPPGLRAMHNLAYTDTSAAVPAERPARPFVEPAPVRKPRRWWRLG